MGLQEKGSARNAQANARVCFELRTNTLEICDANADFVSTANQVLKDPQ